MNHKLHLVIWAGFILMVLAQWAVPAQMIRKKQAVLNNGAKYRFRVAPIDPNDPFRGKYIVLNFRDNVLTLPSRSNKLQNNDKVFVTFAKDRNGFSRISEITRSRPARPDYLETVVWYQSAEKDSTSIYVEFPFNKYYMEEYKAPAAEEIFTQRVIDTSQIAYAVVSILNGDAVINNVFVNDSSIHEILKNRKP